MINSDLLSASEEVRLSCWCVEESSVNLVFGQTSTQVFQALRGILFHIRFTENPVSVTWRWKKGEKKPNRIRKRKADIKQKWVSWWGVGGVGEERSEEDVVTVYTWIWSLEQLQWRHRPKSGFNLISEGNYLWRRWISHHLSHRQR